MYNGLFSRSGAAAAVLEAGVTGCASLLLFRLSRGKYLVFFSGPSRMIRSVPIQGESPLMKEPRDVYSSKLNLQVQKGEEPRVPLLL